MDLVSRFQLPFPMSRMNFQSLFHFAFKLNSPPPSFFQSAVVSQGENGNATDSHGVENNLGVDQPPKVPSDVPNTRIVPNPDSIAPGR